MTWHELDQQRRKYWRPEKGQKKTEEWLGGKEREREREQERGQEQLRRSASVRHLGRCSSLLRGYHRPSHLDKTSE
jgi:hypothetical protein